MSTPHRKVLFITLEPISKQMAGPAIRAVELAKQLNNEFDVTVFSPRSSDLSHNSKDFPKIQTGLNKRQLYQLAQESDVLFIQANVLKPYPGLARLSKYLVVDLYDPYLFSVLAQYDQDQVTAASSYKLMHQILEKHMAKADFCVCASERQRDYWLGRFCALGRLTPEMYRLDRSFRKLIDVVPFGLPDTKPARIGAGIKGKLPGINESDYVLLWGGGIWEWFDPLTVIEAVAKVSKTEQRLKLFFMGWRSPNPQVEIMPMALKAKALAQQLGVLNSHVFFGTDWIPYEERVNYLLDADVAVSAHFDLPETRFSFRTRILDYLWAGLPVLTTCGDELAETIEKNQAGIALPYEDVQAWETALSNLLKNNELDQKFRQGSLNLSKQFYWSSVVEPLRQFLKNPYKLPKFEKITMPSLMERLHAVYSRGGKELVMKRSKDVLGDIFK